MKCKFFIFSLLFIGLLGCKRILIYSAGIRNPQEENKESLKEFVDQTGLDTNDIFIPLDTAAFYKLNKISSSQSGYVFFNSTGQMLMYKDTGSACSAPVISFVQNLCLKESPLFYKKYDTSLITKKIKPLCIKNSADKKYDFYVCVFWYKYFGKAKFKNDVTDIVNVLKKDNCNIKIYLINLDLQPGWKKDIPIKIL